MMPSDLAKLVHNWFTPRIYHGFMSDIHLPESTTQPNQQRYHAILLRYWREGETVVWRYVAQDLGTGEHYTFANMDILIAFLYQHMESQAGQMGFVVTFS